MKVHVQIVAAGAGQVRAEFHTDKEPTREELLQAIGDALDMHAAAADTDEPVRFIRLGIGEDPLIA